MSGKRTLVCRRGIFGGTFNPPHWGHLAIAQAALQQGQLQQVIWVPSHQPPHRSDEDLLAFEYRWQMVQRAIAPHTAFAASDLERHRPGRSFAIDTLTHLQQSYPASQWFWIVGLDTFQSLPRWYQSQQVVPQCTWLVAPRPSPAKAPNPQPSALEGAIAVAETFRSRGITLEWVLLDLPPIPISSSLIRSRMGHSRSAAQPTWNAAPGRSPIYTLVPPSLEDYILQHDLYRAPS